MTLSDATILVRRKASSSLVKLGSSMPDIFIPILDNIAPAILDLSKSDRIMKTESRLLMEFLVVVISGSRLDVEAKKRYLAVVLEDDFKSLDMYSTALSNSDAFYQIMVPFPLSSWIQSLGDLTVSVKAQFEQLFRWRQNFINILLSFRHWIRKSVEISKKNQVDCEGLWSPYIPKLLSITLLWIKYFECIE